MNRKLPNKQVELLCTLLSRPLIPQDAAFQTCTSVSGATRTMNALSTKGLTFADGATTGAGADYCWTVTPKGVEWVRENRARVEEVHLDLGFRLEDIASIYTHQLG